MLPSLMVGVPFWGAYGTPRVSKGSTSAVFNTDSVSVRLLCEASVTPIPPSNSRSGCDRLPLPSRYHVANSEPLHHGNQSRPREPELGSGSVRSADNALGFVKYCHDVRPFGVGQGRDG